MAKNGGTVRADDIVQLANVVRRERRLRHRAAAAARRVDPWRPAAGRCGRAQSVRPAVGVRVRRRALRCAAPGLRRLVVRRLLHLDPRHPRCLQSTPLERVLHSLRQQRLCSSK